MQRRPKCLLRDKDDPQIQLGQSEMANLIGGPKADEPRLQIPAFPAIAEINLCRTAATATSHKGNFGNRGIRGFNRPLLDIKHLKIERAAPSNFLLKPRIFGVLVEIGE